MTQLEKSVIAAPDMPLRPPTFGAWLDCGEVNRLVRTISDTGEEAVEFRANEAAIARWLKWSTGLSTSQIVQMPSSVGRAIYGRLIPAIPSMSYAKPSIGDPVKPVGDGIEIKLTDPISGHQGPIVVLKLRHPTFGDVIKAGDIATLRVMKTTALGEEVPSTEEVINVDAVGNWFETLSATPLTILRSMSYRDAHLCFAHLKPLVSEIADANFDGPSLISGSRAA